VHSGIKTYINASNAIALSNVMNIDNELVIDWSFNFTKAVEETNAKDLIVIQSKGLAPLCTDNWRNHHRHCIPPR
jgi:hypothetical protein